KIAAKEKAQYDKQLDKWRKIYQKVEHRQNTISRADPHGGQLLKKKMHAVKAQGRNLEEKKEQLRKPYEPEEAIDVFFDEVDLNPNKVILDLELPLLQIEEKVLGRDIKLKVFGKDKICIIADNGTGKSTLMKKIYELLKDREDIRLGYMPQNYSEMMDMDVTAVDFLWDGVSKDSRSRASTLLGTLKFTAEEMEHSIAHLSEGQKCKLFFAKLIYDHDDVLLLDEPTRNLSALSGPKIREILCAFKGCIIAISHDRKFIDEVADSVYELSESGLRCLDDDL
ncbi:MAG: ABC-F family ATP-binding cassette domain-containing protein, partial [Erysipelotrichaceae bacterium]|nr:ABC-F family ATP-binding cassette domain-containing protein [Erysipelotrichaceae bacterium]